MFENLPLFLVSTIIFILSPGMDTIFVINKSLSSGVKNGYISAAGIASGVLFHTLFAALGLSIILSKSAFAFSVIKYVGAAYLIYLGVKAFREKIDLEEIVESSVKKVKKVSPRKIFLMAAMTNILNPKVALFFMAFFPQFVSPKAEGQIAPFFILGGIYSVLSIIWLMIVAYCISRFASKIRTSPKAQKIIQGVSGVTFVGLGLKLATADK